MFTHRIGPHLAIFAICLALSCACLPIINQAADPALPPPTPVAQQTETPSPVAGQQIEILDLRVDPLLAADQAGYAARFNLSQEEAARRLRLQQKVAETKLHTRLLYHESVGLMAFRWQHEPDFALVITALNPAAVPEVVGAAVQTAGYGEDGEIAALLRVQQGEILFSGDELSSLFALVTQTLDAGRVVSAGYTDAGRNKVIIEVLPVDLQEALGLLEPLQAETGLDVHRGVVVHVVPEHDFGRSRPRYASGSELPGGEPMTLSGQIVPARDDVQHCPLLVTGTGERLLLIWPEQLQLASWFDHNWRIVDSRRNEALIFSPEDSVRITGYLPTDEEKTALWAGMDSFSRELIETCPAEQGVKDLFVILSVSAESR